MTLAINAKTFTANSFSDKAVGYFGPAKTASVKDDARLAYSPAKPTDSYSGNVRANVKLSRTHTLTGAKTTSADALVVVDISVPVGTASADIDAMLNDVGALLSSTSSKTLVKNAQINY